MCQISPKLPEILQKTFWSLFSGHGVCTNFYQNRPSFVKDMTKTFWLTFFLDTVYCNIRSKSTNTGHIVQSFFLGEQTNAPLAIRCSRCQFRFRVIGGVVLHAVEDFSTQPTSSRRRTEIILFSQLEKVTITTYCNLKATSRQSFSALIMRLTMHQSGPMKFLHNFTGVKRPKFGLDFRPQSPLYYARFDTKQHSKLYSNSRSADN